jgi:hypothetical protein
MAKGDPEAQRKSSLSDCTWLENENESFNLENENGSFNLAPGSSLYFCTYSYFSLFLFFLSFFHSFSHSFIFLSYIR